MYWTTVHVLALGRTRYHNFNLQLLLQLLVALGRAFFLQQRCFGTVWLKYSDEIKASKTVECISIQKYHYYNTSNTSHAYAYYSIYCYKNNLMNCSHCVFLKYRLECSCKLDSYLMIYHANWGWSVNNHAWELLCNNDDLHNIIVCCTD